jgi:hypothetical protein
LLGDLDAMRLPRRAATVDQVIAELWTTGVDVDNWCSRHVLFNGSVRMLW